MYKNVNRKQLVGFPAVSIINDTMQISQPQEIPLFYNQC